MLSSNPPTVSIQPARVIFRDIEEAKEWHRQVTNNILESLTPHEYGDFVQWLADDATVRKIEWEGC